MRLLKVLWGLLRDTAAKWSKDNVPRLGASLAFYSLLSVAPLLVIATAILGAVYGPELARGQLLHEVRDFVGDAGGGAIEMLLASANHPTTGTFASIAGGVLLLFGAAGVFSELQDSLNLIWGAECSDCGLWHLVKSRLLTFCMVLLVGVLLLASVIFSAALTAVINYAGGKWPRLAGWLHWGDVLLSLLILTVLFALLFKVLPQASVSWGDVWLGALVTALLFTVGKVLIGIYLASSGVSSTYGAAGSLAVFLIWIYYSAQVFFFGAEFTAVHARRRGSPGATSATGP
jgi:membrane protein